MLTVDEPVFVWAYKYCDGTKMPEGMNLMTRRYGAVFRLLHWLVAGLLLVLLGLGWWQSGMSLFDRRLASVSMWHKSLGVLVFLLTVLRLLWCCRQQTLPAIGSKLERQLARVVRAGLYGLVLLAAVSGYVLATGSGRTLELFGLVSLPAVWVWDAAMLDQIRTVHMLSVWTLAALIGLHVLAVIKHQFDGGEPVLRRML